MTVTLELTAQRYYRGNVIGTLRVLVDGSLVFADSANLSTAKGRSEYAAAASGRLNGAVPDGLDWESELLALLQEAEHRLAADPAPSRPSAADDEKRIESYVRRDGHYEHVKVVETRAGPIEQRTPLSNFTAEIVEDQLHDDGLSSQRHFLIKGTCTGRALPDVRLTADEFQNMTWPTKYWGVGVRVLPGQGRRELLADCTKAFSANANLRKIYRHTGWRSIDSKLLYLSGSGAIGSDGFHHSIEVELDGKLGLYQLPEPQEGERLSKAVRTSWDSWRVAVPAASATAMGVVYGAPLAEWLTPDFVIWLYGHTGELKTSYAALLLAHFGEFSYTAVPLNWEATANYLEKALFLLKDVPALVDDFRPAADRYEAQDMRRKAARVLRTAGNRSGRGRMASDTSLRPEYFCRGIPIVTAEERLAGESSAARAWEIEFQAGTVEIVALSEFQARTEQLRLAMAGYVGWLAGRLEGGAGWLRELRAQALRQAVGIQGHLRHRQTFSHLLTAWVVFAEFAQAAGAVTPEEAVTRLDQVRKALLEVANRQADVARRVRPEIVFIDTLGDILAGGKGHLVGQDGRIPPQAERWGWHVAEEMQHPQGDKLGWLTDDAVCLIPSMAHRLVARIVSERGDTFIVSEHALHRALERGGFLIPGNKGLRHNLWAEGRVVNSIRLELERLLAAWGEGAE